jgi:hypothetical protein
MRLSYQSEKLLNLLKEGSAVWGDLTQEFQRVIKKIRQLSTMGKVIASLILQDYEDIAALLDNIAEGPK